MKTFEKDIAEFNTEAFDEFEKTRRALIINVGSMVIDKTPVGKPEMWRMKIPKGYKPGGLKRNWHTTLGAPSDSDVEDVDPLGSVPKGELVSVAKASQFNQSVFMTNNRSYAYDVEYNGHAIHAGPEGMVRITFASI
jgi:hypothetical protein